MPSDLSSAAFFLVAALLVPGSQLTIHGVGLNPTRSALLDFLVGMGAKIRVPDLESVNGELIGEIQVEHSALRGGVIDGGLTAALIDEIPVLAVLGAATEEGLTVKDASELRIKETDRIKAVVENLRRMGVEAEESADGMYIPGAAASFAARRSIRSAIIESRWHSRWRGWPRTARRSSTRRKPRRCRSRSSGIPWRGLPASPADISSRRDAIHLRHLTRVGRDYRGSEMMRTSAGHLRLSGFSAFFAGVPGSPRPEFCRAPLLVR